MEYVHTYGWVLLAVTVIGAMTVNYNVSSADYLVPKECIFFSGVDCLDMVVDQNLLSIVLVNEFGFALGNLSLEISGTCNSTANTTDGNPYANPNVLVENQQATFVFECAEDLTDRRLSEDITILFRSVDTGEAHVKLGTLEYAPGE